MHNLISQVLAENLDLQRLSPSDGPVVLTLGHGWIRDMLAELLLIAPDNSSLLTAYQLIGESAHLDQLAMEWHYGEDDYLYNVHFRHLQALVDEAVSLLK